MVVGDSPRLKWEAELVLVIDNPSGPFGFPTLNTVSSAARESDSANSTGGAWVSTGPRSVISAK